jgi:hypothetical protein
MTTAELSHLWCEIAVFVCQCVFVATALHQLRKLPWRKIGKRLRGWWPVSRSIGRGWL